MIVLENLLEAESPEQTEEGKLLFRTQLNAAHTIYEGHFPERPITPGVCLLQAAQELLERHMDRKYLLSSCRSVKFLRPVEPLDQSTVDFELQFKPKGDELEAVCHVKKEDQLCAKFSARFRQIHPMPAENHLPD